MPKGKERRLVYIREYREDGRLVVRAIPAPEEVPAPMPVQPLVDLEQKVS
nr:hypothetical protein [uncultured Holophaga sp.]